MSTRSDAQSVIIGISTFCMAAAVLIVSTSATATESINALVWCDHTDPEFIQPFEEANDVKVNLKEFETTLWGDKYNHAGGVVNQLYRRCHA